MPRMVFGRGHWKRRALNFIIIIYLLLLAFAVMNQNPRCRVQMPIMFADPLFTKYVAGGRCQVDFQNLELQSIDIFERPNMSSIEALNPEVQHGGKWAPNDCQAWQKVAILIPYRDRWDHLVLLLKRLHPLLRKHKLRYQIFVIEQANQDKFNRGRLLNVGVLESLKKDQFDCFIFHDVDLLPEHDKNLYYCDDHVRHLAAAIDEMRYHVMYYNYAGGVVALNKKNVFKINGYSNDYWGWGKEDDDFSARTMGAGLLLTRPPEHIGRYKMVRHTKEWGTNYGYGLFMSWRSRWQSDGLNSLNEKKYRIVEKEANKLFTNIKVEIGQAPSSPPIDESAPKESTFWFLRFFFP